MIYYVIAVVVAVIFFQIIRSSLSQPGNERFEGKYEEIGFYRNENNTGPVQRVYAIKVLDESGDWLKEFADSQPHTKYGRTLVFFFSNDVPNGINLTASEPYFSSEFLPFLRAKFEKTPMGESRFEQIQP